MGTRTTTTTSAATMKATDASEASLKRRLKDAANRYENQKCCDCGDMKPSWASLLVPPPGSPNDATTLGALCCFHCAGAHRRLGVHICFVRSLTLDDWNEREVEAMEKGGNRIINEAYEAKIMNGTVDSNKAKKPIPSSNLETRNAFVKKKYCKRKFLNATKFIPAGKEDLFAGFQQSMFDDNFPPSQQQQQQQQPLSTTTQKGGGDFIFQSGGGIDLLASPSPTKKATIPTPSEDPGPVQPTSNKNLNLTISITGGNGDNDDDDDSDINSQAVFGNAPPVNVKRNLNGTFGSMKNIVDDEDVEFVDLKGRYDDDENNNNNINKGSNSSSSKGASGTSNSPQRRSKSTERKQASRRSRSKSARRTRSSKSPRSLSQERTNDANNSGDMNGKNTRGRRNHSSYSRSPGPGLQRSGSPVQGKIKRVNSLDVADVIHNSSAYDDVVDKRPASCSHLCLDMKFDHQNSFGRKVERVRSKASRDDSGDLTTTWSKDFDNMSTISGTKSEFGGREWNKNNIYQRPRRSSSLVDSMDMRSESGMVDTGRKPRQSGKSLFGYSSAHNPTTNQMQRRPSMKGRRKPPSRSKSSDDIDLDNMNNATRTTARKPARRTSSPKRGQLTRSKSADDELLSPMVVQRRKKSSKSLLPCPPKM